MTLRSAAVAAGEGKLVLLVSRDDRSDMLVTLRFDDWLKGRRM